MILNSKLQKLIPLLLDWFSKHARDLPWRRTRDPYAIWVSEIMLQQTQVKTAIPFWNRWMRELPTIEAAAKAPSAKIHKLWEGLGYYTRVRNLQKAAQQIVAQQTSRRRRGDESQTKNKGRDSRRSSLRFPEKFEEVLALPGIGRYTAGAICSIAFNQPTPILDGNVIRVLTRIFGIAGNPKEKAINAKLWKLAEDLVKEANSGRGSALRRPDAAARRPYQKHSCSHLNQSLMELGALICSPRNAQCLICPVKKICVAFKTNRVETLPEIGKREKATARRFIALVLERDGIFLVRQRPAGVVNAHLWEFPNIEVAAGILRVEKPGVPPGGKNGGNFKRVNNTWKIPGGKLPTSTTGGTPVATMLADAARVLNFDLRDAKPLCTVKHSITRYRIILEAFQARLGGASSTSPHSNIMLESLGIRPAENTGIWRTPAQMRRLAFTSAHKQILGSLEKRC